MKKMFVKTICILSLIGYVGIASAQCDSCCAPEPKPTCEPCRACEICPPCEPCKPCCTEVPSTGEPCNCAYNAPARIDPACGWDMWVTGSFIYWQAKEKGLELGYEFNRKTSDTENVVKYDTLNMEFDYLPGFKVGAGFSMCRDDWTLYLEYTRLNGKNTFKKELATEDNYLASSWDPASLGQFLTPRFNSLSAKWKLDYNIFDLELGRPYYLGKKVIFKPHFGLRGGWIDQNYDIKEIYSTTNVVYNWATQDSWVIGPRAGLVTDWIIGCDFRIFGNAAASLLYQDFDISKKTHSYDSDVLRTNFKTQEKQSYITPNVELGLGLGYGSYFWNNEWYFDLAVGYDFHYIWNQNMMRHLNDELKNELDTDAGNLMMHGLTVSARLDF